MRELIKIGFSYPFRTVDAFLKELLFLSELALLLVESREVVEANDLKELILESSLNAWLGLLNIDMDRL